MERLDLSAAPARGEPTTILRARSLALRLVGGAGVIAQLEVRPEGLRSMLEELHAGRDVQRRHVVAALPGDPQQLAAGDDDAQLRRDADEPGVPV